ncbi:hypothetical protein [Streptomyces sp. yr375]|nr:hypothetical protein [Streptomyces sp. yr375]
MTSLAAVLVGYGYPGVSTPADRVALESALAAFLYKPLEKDR